MKSQGDRQEYLWKPNDYSSATRLRYDMEVDHYMRSIRNNEISKKKTSISADLGTIGVVFSLMFSLILLVITSIIELVKLIKTN